jgi:hypothetical protein
MPCRITLITGNHIGQGVTDAVLLVLTRTFLNIKRDQYET